MVDELLKNVSGLVVNRFNEVFPTVDGEYATVVDAARYSFLNGGKRIRPALLLEFYHLCGGENDHIIDFCVALEMIHTYSLIHDDLPCMDNDDFRRGKPSCHKAFGEAMALLAGDALLTNSFSVASSALGFSPENSLKAVRLLSEKAGVNGMVGGQVIDLSIENKATDIEVVKAMYQKKTGALLEAACMIGCVLADADNSKIQLAYEYASNLGLAFQVIDDILDNTADEKLLGKPVGSDEKNKKTTFVTHYGIEKCRDIAKELTDTALHALEKFDGDKKNLIDITEFLLTRKY